MFSKMRHSKRIPVSGQGQRFYLKSLQINPSASPAYDQLFIPAQNTSAIFDPRLPKSALKVMNFLISRRRKHKGYLDEENQFIANCLRISYSSVQKAMQLLEWLGYIARSVKRNKNDVRNTERRIYIAYNWKPKSKAYENSVIEQNAHKALDAKIKAIRTYEEYAELDTQQCFEKLKAEYPAKSSPHHNYGRQRPHCR